MQNLTPELRAYIDSSRASGIADDTIRQALIAIGWETSSVDQWLGGSPQTQPLSIVVPQNPVTSGASVGTYSLRFRDLFKNALAIFKKRWITIFKFNLISLLVMVLTASLITALAFFGMTNTYPLASLMVGIATALAMIVVVMAYTPTLLHIIAGHEQNIGIGEAWSKGRKQIWATFVLHLLTVLVNIGGMLLLVIPGWIWSTNQLVVGWVLVVEDLRGIKAITRARQLVKGDWWVLISDAAVMSLFLSLFFIPAAILQGVITNVTIASIVTVVSVLVVQITILPLAYCFNFSIYEALKVKKAAAPPIKSALWFRVAAVLGFLYFLLALSPLVISMYVLFGKSGKTDASKSSTTNSYATESPVEANGYAPAITADDVTAMRNALVAYHDEHGSYPSSLDQLAVVYPDHTVYSAKQYEYEPSSDGQKFELYYRQLTLGGQGALNRNMSDRDLSALLAPSPLLQPSPAPTTAPSPAPTDVTSMDEDNDGLTSADEMLQKTSPTTPDSDSDGLADGDEVKIFLTLPLVKSSADSPFTDGENLANGFDPLKPGSKIAKERIDAIRAIAASVGGFHQPTIATLGTSSQLLK